MNADVPLRFEAIGAQWKDVTGYSQGGSRVPRTWQTTYPDGQFRIMLTRLDGVWRCKSYHPTTDWQPVLPAIVLNDPQAAACEAMMTISRHFRRLADSILSTP